MFSNKFDFLLSFILLIIFAVIFLLVLSTIILLVCGLVVAIMIVLLFLVLKFVYLYFASFLAKVEIYLAQAGYQSFVDLDRELTKVIYQLETDEYIKRVCIMNFPREFLITVIPRNQILDENLRKIHELEYESPLDTNFSYSEYSVFTNETPEIAIQKILDTINSLPRQRQRQIH